MPSRKTVDDKADEGNQDREDEEDVEVARCSQDAYAHTVEVGVLTREELQSPDTTDVFLGGHFGVEFDEKLIFSSQRTTGICARTFSMRGTFRSFDKPSHA